jgi:D-hexose-6-phosphate mutarotase
MSAMKNDAYKTMLCIETANAMEDGQTLQPGESHTLTAAIYGSL